MATNTDKRGPKPRFPVAVVGMSCRLPGAGDIDEFWELLRTGTDAVTEIPRDRWDVDYYFHPDPAHPGRTYANAGGFLRDIDAFDANFFGISPREARQMDPQQRILLELTWEALESADIVPATLAGSDTGVFIGSANVDYGLLQRSAVETLTDPYGVSGSASSINANRISHFFDLSGPSMAIDTACSSGLVAVHQACESLWSSESGLAVAGGINLILLPESMVGFAKAAMLSPKGRCRAFDADADGYVRSEGGGIVILKPLAAAIADGNPIHAVLLGSAVNSDGRTKGIALPNPVAQEKLLRRVYSGSGVDPATVDYVEAHGTGTNAGDRVECAALGRVFGASRSADQPCRIGSVKTNVGHLEPASGIVGLLKAILTLKHRAIPPTVHFRRPNPKIPFGELNLSVVAELTPLPQEKTLLAGVNSFGFGGTNAHVILRSHEPVPTAAAELVSGDTAPLLLSARSTGALKAMAQAYAQLLRSANAPPLGAICSAAARRSHHSFRIATFGSAAEEVASRLEAFASDQPALMLAESQAHYQQSRLAFVFSGNGSQWIGMGRDLLAQEPVFADCARQIDALLRPLVGWSVLEVLQSDETSDLYDKTEIAQPALFAVQAGIVEVLRRRGITAEAMIGHSVGEIAAAYAAGALTLEQACQVIACRSQAQGRTAGAGTMAAVGLGEDEAREAIAAFDGALTLATVNSPNSVTLAGDHSALEALRLMLKPRGVYCRLLGLDYAFHSAAMDPIQQEIMDGLADLKPRSGSHRFISGVTGADQDGAALDATYWWDNIRKPVQFAKAIQHLVDDGIDVFVEVGPHPILAGYLRECLQSRSANGKVAIPTLRRGEGERDALWMTVARCYTASVALDYSALFAGRTPWVALPAYPWQRERHWYGKIERISLPLFSQRQHPLLGYRMQTGEQVWRNQLDPAKVAYLADHTVQGAVVFPASGYAELALAAGALHFETEAVEIEGLEIRRPLVFSGRVGPWVEFDLAAEELSFRISNQEKAEPGQPPIAVGRLGALASDVPRPTLALEQLQARLVTRVSAAEHYRRCAAHGLAYGPQFQGVAELWAGPSEALARIVPPEAVVNTLDDYRLHPVLLDACLQAVAAAVGPDVDDEAGAAYVPTGIDRLRLFGRGRHATWCHVTVSRADRGAIVADFEVFDGEGGAVADVAGVRFHRLGAAKSSEIPAWHWELHLQPGRLSGGTAADLPSVFDLAGALRREVEAMAREAEQASSAQEVAPALERLAALYARRVLGRLGLDEVPKPLSALMDGGRIEPEFGRYVEALLRLAQTHNLAVEQPGGWIAVGQMAEDAAEKHWRNVLGRHPDWLASLELIARCGEQALGVLGGEVDAESVLSPERDYDAGEQLRDGDPWFRIGNEIAAEVLRRLGSTQANRSLRIIEVGGASGSLTAAVLDSLPANRIDYLFTDPSEAAMSRAQGRFGEHGFMRFAVLDLDRDPSTQGFEIGQADIVLASCALSDAAEAAETATHLKALLKPSGLLILTEARPSPVLDFAFGLRRRRWFYTDTELRPESPLLPAARWAALLRESGFAETAVLGDDFAAVASPVVLARNNAANGHAVAEPPVEIRHWVVLAGAGDASADRIARCLAETHQRVTMVVEGADFHRSDDGVVRSPLAIPSDYQRLVAELREDLAGGVDLIYARGMARRRNGAALDPVEAQERGSLGLLLLVQALAEAGLGGSVRIWVVTKGAIATPLGSATIDAAQAPLWGVARTLQNERPDITLRLIDISSVESDELTLRMLASELLWPGPEDEVVLRGAARYVHRLQHGMPLPVPSDAEAEGALAPAAYRLVLRPGDRHDGLALIPIALPQPATGEVLVRVVAAGLNYRDVLQRVGVLPEQAFEGGFAGPTLGMEFSGEVIAVGSGVSGFRPGEGVFGFAPGAFASHLAVPAAMLFRKPAALNFEAAATLPVAALTAYYSLHHVARLQKGERVLIHGAAGGVGLAAIQYARSVGAEIFATAGTPAKRDFLRRLGVPHVLDSRSLAFADQIRLITKREGVDVVLNSLAGEALHKGVSLLRPYGRFIELGKRDFWANTKLGLQPFRNNIQFSGVDVDRLLVDRPALAQQLLQELGARIAAGDMGALPCRRFPVTRAAEAFRHMQQSRHIGKVVLGFDCDATPERQAPSSGLALSGEATYLVTGGRGGFGLATALWLAEKGARHLVLIGRSATAKPEAAEALERLRGSGVTVREVALDVADAGGLKGLIDGIGREMPPLRGVVHCAAVIDDAALANMTPDRFYAVLRPKVLGAANLDQLTRELPLDFFVMYSSAVTLFGNPGQANYMAANLYLEALGADRRARGLPALVVQWGAIEGVGHLARHTELAKVMSERMGVKMLTPERALARLEAAMVAGASQVALADINWSRLTVMPQLARAPKYVLVRPSAGEGVADGESDAGELKEKLGAMPEAERLSYIEQLVVNHLAGVLRMPASKLDVHHSLMDLGMDSLMVVELQLAIEQQFGITVSPVEVMDVATVAQLVQRVAEKLGVDAGQMAAEAPTAGNGIMIDTMPSEMLDDVLGELLEPEAHHRATERVT